MLLRHIQTVSESAMFLDIKILKSVLARGRHGFQNPGEKKIFGGLVNMLQGLKRIGVSLMVSQYSGFIKGSAWELYEHTVRLQPYFLIVIKVRF